MATGLDNHHPFNNMPVVELILQNAGLMLTQGTPQIGWGHANAVWALMSNFIALDHLSATFGAATAAPGQPVAQRHCEETIAIGTAEVSLSLPICLIWTSLAPAGAYPTYQNTQQVLHCLGHSLRGWGAIWHKHRLFWSVVRSFSSCAGHLQAPCFQRKAESSDKHDVRAWHVSIGTSNLQRGLYFSVVVSYSVLIFWSRMKGSFLMNSQNSRNVSLGKYYLLLSIFKTKIYPGWGLRPWQPASLIFSPQRHQFCLQGSNISGKFPSPYHWF